MSSIVPYNFTVGNYRVHVQSDVAIGETLGGNNVNSNTYYFNKNSNGSYFIDILWKNLFDYIYPGNIWTSTLRNKTYYVLHAAPDTLYFYLYDINNDVWIRDKGEIPIDWSIVSSIQGHIADYFWSDGKNDYFSHKNGAQYKVNINSDNVVTFTSINWNVPVHGPNIWNEKGHIYYSEGLSQYELDINTNTWIEKLWVSEPFYFNPSCIWTDGDNIYYSNEYKHYILDKNANIWKPIQWTGLSSFDGSHIWTDADNNIYYSYGNSQYKFDKNNNKWITAYWYKRFFGEYVWKDGNDVYLSDGTKTYILNTYWEETSYGAGIDGRQIWSDGENNYYSNNTTQYKFNSETKRFDTVNWGGSYIPKYGEHVWTDGNNIYYSLFSYAYGDAQYKLNKNTNTWEQKNWNGFAPPYGNYVWSNGENIYYCDDDTQYVLDKNLDLWVPIAYQSYLSIIGMDIWKDNNNLYYSHYGQDQWIYDKNNNIWIKKDWGDNYPEQGQYIWTDRHDIYYSTGTKQYILNKNTNVWDEKEWNIENINGAYIKTIYNKTLLYQYSGNNGTYILNNGIWELANEYCSFNPYVLDMWSDEENTYLCIPYSYQLKLNKETHVWQDVVWNSSGLTYIMGRYVWTDGSNIYYSSDREDTVFHIVKGNYVLDKYTNTWNLKTWYGLTEFSGTNVWTDGNDIYYSYSNQQYILNKNTNTWHEKNWGINFYAGNIWKDNKNNIYLSQTTNGTFILDKENQTWVQHPLTGLNYFNGSYVWTDKRYNYYSNNNEQYIFNSDTKAWTIKQWDDNKKPIFGHLIWTDGTYTYFSGSSLYSPSLDSQQYILISKEEKNNI